MTFLIIVSVIVFVVGFVISFNILYDDGRDDFKSESGAVFGCAIASLVVSAVCAGLWPLSALVGISYYILLERKKPPEQKFKTFRFIFRYKQRRENKKLLAQVEEKKIELLAQQSIYEDKVEKGLTW